MDKIRRKNAQRIIVAMSGGVDSSVAAAILKRTGFAFPQGQGNPERSRRVDVIGVFIKFWAEHKRGELPGLNRCCSPEAEIRARKVAKILKIPCYVFNFEKEFKKRVVDYFFYEHKKGTTPNPCVVCNKEIKFGLLLEKALSLDADFVATGHYARLRREIPNGAQPKAGREVGGLESKFQIPDYKLLKAKDKNKDQSYFLWQLSQNQLSRILFPIGNYTKEEVRKLAKKFGLPVFDTSESQEICFISGNIEDFFKKYLKEKPGNIVDKQGKILGRHRGLWFYTIGQRKGIGLSGGPYFVLDKNIKQNVLIVTKNEKNLLKKELSVNNINWILGKAPKFSLKIKAKIRYRHQPASATISKIQSRKYKILFDRPQRAITSGQSVVFYKGQELLGGGIICYNE